MLNKLTLIGRVGKAPESRTVNASTVCNFSIAVDDGYFDKQNKWIDQVIWVNITAWAKLAERCQKLEKGERVLVDGKLVIKKVEGEKGTQYFTECAAQTIRRLDPKKVGDTAPQFQPQRMPPPDDELPF